MNFYHQRKNVDLYKELMKDYDTGNVLDLVKQVLPKHSTILQLGMGTGADLLKLS
ncbi:hypothetical protein [Megamonas rupellensis]|jgi:hypothetical protein|uniref:hypothetical protein n=1 Tax=Megamonas rupellensis TaxID=491921 RepID=UPI0015F351AE|nr:hypothetical protein [Megamonas rupellensis]